jgi:GNAT superfamily N-acetyltransferase
MAQNPGKVKGYVICRMGWHARPAERFEPGRRFSLWKEEQRIVAIIRPYAEERDAPEVGILIADTYGRYNLDFVPGQEHGPFLGPFQHARSDDPNHRQAIVRTIRSAIVLVAEQDREIVGVLRGRKERLASLFVRGDRHRQGIGHRLVTHFEAECLRQGWSVIRVAATLYAVPFYLAQGYKRSTGIRNGRSFQGRGLRYQPMRKRLQ